MHGFFSFPAGRFQNGNPGFPKLKDTTLKPTLAFAVENEVAHNMYQRSELDYLTYNDPIAYADLILNDDPATYLKTVTEYKSLD